MDRQSFPFVKVHWVDAVSVDDWTAIEEIQEEPGHEIITIGHLIKETKSTLVIASNFDPSESLASCIMVIPKKYLTKPIKVIK